jgi:hypothetical protein
LDHGTDHLVAEHERQLGVGQFTIHHVQVGPADAAGMHPNQELVWAGFGPREICLAEIRSGGH